MDVVNIFLTDRNAETMDDFVHAGRRYTFARIDAAGPQRLVEGPVWAFVDWVLDDLAGLEMCRRLRSDPRTSEAHITMVLEADDPDDRRRALKAGADDYMLGPVDRNAVLDRVIAVDPLQQQRRIGQRFEVGDLTIDMTALQARAQALQTEVGSISGALTTATAELARVMQDQKLSTEQSAAVGSLLNA